MRHASMLIPALLLAALAAGCGGQTSSGSGSQSSSGSGPINEEPCSVDDVQGPIPGVSISISSSRCVYHVGEAAKFTYTVTTTQSVPPIEIQAGSSCGECKKPSPDPLSFVRYRIGGTSDGGEMQTYCLCDVGCCPPDEAATIQVNATTASQTIQWSGRQWTGPSDTSNPEGDFFKPGKYGVDVTFNGRGQGSLTATLPIEIVP